MVMFEYVNYFVNTNENSLFTVNGVDIDRLHSLCSANMSGNFPVLPLLLTFVFAA